MRVITLDSNKKIIGVKIVGNNYILQTNDIVTEIGELGQIQQADGTFITPSPTPETTQTSIEDKINFIYYKLKGVV